MNSNLYFVDLIIIEENQKRFLNQKQSAMNWEKNTESKNTKIGSWQEERFGWCQLCQKRVLLSIEDK